jgi:hypothetical protein
VPESWRTSGDLVILVEEPAETVAPSDLVDVDWRAVGERARGCSLIQGAVRPVTVVVALELAEHGCRVSLIDDQEAVEEFAADGADEALGDCVGSRCAHRRLDDADLGGGEDGVESGGELAVAVAEEESEVPVGVVEVHEQVARQLGEPGSGRMSGDAEDVDAAGGVLDDEERVEPLQGDRVDVEQVAGQDRLGLHAEELRPGRTVWVPRTRSRHATVHILV